MFVLYVFVIFSGFVEVVIGRQGEGERETGQVLISGCKYF